jgi:hypothetical protein
MNRIGAGRMTLEIETAGPATGERALMLARKRRRLTALNRQIALVEVDLLSL